MSVVKYTREHEWVRIEGDIATVGITFYAQEQLGDVVFVELPDEHTSVDQGAEVAIVESVKAASDIYAPITGTIVETNGDLSDRPELINEDPENDGWFFRMQLSDPSEIEDLLDEAAYHAFIQDEM